MAGALHRSRAIAELARRRDEEIAQIRQLGLDEHVEAVEIKKVTGRYEAAVADYQPAHETHDSDTHFHW